MELIACVYSEINRLRLNTRAAVQMRDGEGDGAGAKRRTRAALRGGGK